MSIEIIIVLILTLVAIVLFVTELVSVDVTAILTMSALAVFGVLTPEEAIKGFSSPATLVVLNMFILSEAIFRTGVLQKVGEKILEISSYSRNRACAFLMLFVGVLSMFINNTAAVALLIPVTLDISKRAGWSPTKLLIPLSFASMFGGVCTLVGTSTNLLASGIMAEKGYGEFSMFSFFHYGIIFFIVGFIYVYFFSDRLIKPRRKPSQLSDDYEIEKYVSIIEVQEGAPIIGKNFNVGEPLKELGIEVLYKEDKNLENVNIVRAGDRLRVKSNLDVLLNIVQEQKLSVVELCAQDIQDENLGDKQFVEVLVAPGSRLINKRVKNANLFDDFDARVVAIRHHREVVHSCLSDMKLKSGDTLLLVLPKKKIEVLRDSSLFIVIKEPETRKYLPEKLLPSLLILGLTIGLAAFNIIPIVISSFLGVSAMIIAGILTPAQAYRAVDWRVVFLLSGLLALGYAMDKSGAAALLSEQLVSTVGGYGEGVMIGAFFGLTVILTSFMSNNASVALMAPLSIYAAESVGMEVQTLVLSVMFGASMSFLTPIGYQTNMMIYNVGHYRFRDFIRVGTPLCAIFLFLASYLLGAF